MTLGDLYDIIVNEKPEGMSMEEWLSMPVMVGNKNIKMTELNWDNVGMVEADVTIENNEGIIPDVPMLIFAISTENIIDPAEDDEFFDPQLN